MKGMWVALNDSTISNSVLHNFMHSISNYALIQRKLFEENFAIIRKGEFVDLMFFEMLLN